MPSIAIDNLEGRVSMRDKGPKFKGGRLLTDSLLMIVSTLEIIVMTIAVAVMLATISVAKRTIMAPVMLMPGFRMVVAPLVLNAVLIMTVMMWKIVMALAIAMIIVIRSFAVIVSVHNGISAAISSVAGIIRILLWIMGTGAGQQRKTDEQHFFSDRIHFYSP